MAMSRDGWGGGGESFSYMWITRAALVAETVKKLRVMDATNAIKFCILSYGAAPTGREQGSWMRLVFACNLPFLERFL